MVNENEFEEDTSSEDIVVTAPEPTSNITKLEEKLVHPRKAVAISPTESLENGGHTCSGCRKELPHADYLGYWDASATVFTVVGYYCSKCETRVLLPKFISEERKQTGKYRTMSGWEKEFWRTK